MNLPTTSIAGQAYLGLTWSQMGKLTVSLAQKIKTSGNHYDRIIALAKGGLGWARQLQDILAVPELSSIQISFYTGIGQTKKSPIVIQSLPITIKDEKILIYDDVVDSGETLALAKDYIKIHGAGRVHSAAHFTKSWTKIVPDFVAASTNAWIIFPHDCLENLRLIHHRWGKLDKKELKERLTRLNIDSPLISFYLATIKNT